MRNRLLIVLSLFLLFPINSFAQEGKKPIQYLYEYGKKGCYANGWKQVVLNVDGIERELFWKGPELWTEGIIIVLHGGGGMHSNYCGNFGISKPMSDFADMAIEQGFGVVAPDSTDGLSTDNEGNSCGKRWDSVSHSSRENVDLSFFKEIFDEVIPGIRPSGSNPDVFLTGVSNGGFMTILVATHFPDKITAFAPVSAGDPYGTHMDCSKNPFSRQNAPGLFLDNETGYIISLERACYSATFVNEEKWPYRKSGKTPIFQQFHHEGDSAVDISCMKKAEQALLQNGFQNQYPYIIPNKGRRRLIHHFWQPEYNQSILNFFKNIH